MYGIVRRDELVDSVNNMVMYDKDYINFKNKISGLIANNNFDYLAKQLIWTPNTVLSMIGTNATSNVSTAAKNNYNDNPIPYFAFIKDNTKMSQLFLGCLYHFSRHILGFNDETGKNSNKSGAQFLTSYLNYNNCNSIVSYNKTAGKATFVK